MFGFSSEFYRHPNAWDDATRDVLEADVPSQAPFLEIIILVDAKVELGIA
mgnify:CR=1 FL=1